jgi:hypothetical protein
MDLTDCRAAEAVVVESRALEDLEAEEAAETLVPDTSLEGLARGCSGWFLGNPSGSSVIRALSRSNPFITSLVPVKLVD